MANGPAAKQALGPREHPRGDRWFYLLIDGLTRLPERASEEQLARILTRRCEPVQLPAIAASLEQMRAALGRATADAAPNSEAATVGQVLGSGAP